MYLKRIVSFLFIVVCCLFLTPKFIFAEDYKSDYQVEYFINDINNTIVSDVHFDIKITNLRSDIYVSKFSISFPKSFSITNLQASDDLGSIIPQMTVDGSQTKIDVEFTNPSTGKGSINNFHIAFRQDNLFKVNGTVWEVVLPTIENRSSSNYKVIVHLPSETDKKVSIAKPKPSLVTSNEIIWDNPTTKTIYAIFGDIQFYDMQLNYHIRNTELIPVYTEVAFPPDMLYQKNYIRSIKPQPSSTYVDSDGNFIGRYFLNPKETENIIYDGITELTVKPREEMKSFVADQFTHEQNYLLTAQKYWQISQLSRIEPLQSVADVYHFTRDSLQYDYQRVSTQNMRFGADAILSNPKQAVCVEFSDLFIATAREKGIYSREIEGYGYSFDPQLRPLSLISDILHSWPEYYDTNSNIWIPVDPTWENTSGIDYFSSLDLNHIAFAIHGKRPDYPLPGGMYKTEDSRDIIVNATTEIPQEKHALVLSVQNMPKSILDTSKPKITLSINNMGNIFETGNVITINAVNISVSPQSISVPLLAPFEKKDFDISAMPLVKNKKSTASISILVGAATLYHSQFSIIPSMYDLSIKIAFIVGAAFLIMLLVRLIRQKK